MELTSDFLSTFAIRELLLGLVLAVCIYTDVLFGKVRNVIVVPAMAAGLVLGAVDTLGGEWRALSDCTLGLLVGGGVLLVPFLFGVMGGGDVKLAAAVGSLTSVWFVLEALSYAFVLAAILALVFRTVQGRLAELLVTACWLMKQKLTGGGAAPQIDQHGDRGVPFALCLAGGVLGAKWLGLFTHLLMSR